jgi:acetyl esterase/lipase
MPISTKPGEFFPLWDGTPPELHLKAETPKNWQPTLAFYPVTRGKPKGTVVVYPGGGYWLRAPHEGAPVAKAFNAFGFSAFVVDYRCGQECEQPLFDGPLRDAARAVRFIRAHAADFGIPSDKIAVLGFSAGAHLVSSLAVHHAEADAKDADNDGFAKVSSRPEAVIPCYGVILSGALAHRGSVHSLAGDDPEWEKWADVPAHVTSQTPPVFLWHTMEDNGVPVENSLRFADSLRSWRVPFALHVFTKGPHGIGLGETDPEAKEWPGLAARWLEYTVFA